MPLGTKADDRQCRIYVNVLTYKNGDSLGKFSFNSIFTRISTDPTYSTV
ncbi:MULTISPECIES: hypothetical protein [Kamptonema]|nr:MULTISPECIES: hypothetical protein [Kamptonema]